MDSRNTNNENDFTTDMTCPITQEIMDDPVITVPCGHTFERGVLEKWTAAHDTCPMCMEKINTNLLVPNLLARSIIEKLLTLHPENLFSGNFIHRLIKDGNLDLIIKIFKAHPDKINNDLVNGKSVLHLAITHGKLAIIEALFSHFKDIDVNLPIKNHGQKNHGRTPILLASYQRNSNVNIVKFLLDKGADPTISTFNGETPLIVALWNEKDECAAALLDSHKELNVNQCIQSGAHKGVTALIAAIEKNCSLPTFLKLLATKDIDINARRVNGESALFIAAAKGDKQKAQALLTMPNIDAIASRHPGDGKTAMQVAGKHPDVVALFTSPEVKFTLLKNTLSGNGIEAAAALFSEIYHDGSQEIMKYLQILHCEFQQAFHSFCLAALPKLIKRAVEKNDVELILTLYRTCPEAINDLVSNGKTVMHLAVQNRQIDLVKKLVDSFPDINLNMRQNHNGATPLLFALIADEHEITTYLLSKDVDLSIPNRQGTTPLIAAICSLNHSVIDLIVKSKKNLNINQAMNGCTALIFAAELCDAETFEKLLSIPNIDVNVKDANGCSAFFTAAANNQETKILAMLKIPGIDIDAKRNDGKTAAQIAEENGHTKVAAILACHHFFSVILNGEATNEKFKLDYLCQVDNQTLDLIFQRLADQISDQKELIARLASFIHRLKEQDVKMRASLFSYDNSFFKDSKERTVNVNMLNQLFKIAHQNYFGNKFDWEKQIRIIAKEDLNNVTQHASPENLELLKWARSQTIFGQNRHTLSVLSTETQRQIDKSIKNMRATLKMS